MEGFQCRPSFWVHSSETTSRLVVVGGFVGCFPALWFERRVISLLYTAQLASSLKSVM